MKNSIKYFSFIVFLFCISCGVQKIGKTEAEKKLSFEYAVIQYNPIEHKFLFSNSEPTSLSEEEIIEAEKIVGQRIRKITDTPNRDLKEPRKYVRQYIAVKNQNGEKEVFIQCISKDIAEDAPEWKTQYLSIADGGSSVISVYVNLTKGTYSYFSIGMFG